MQTPRTTDSRASHATRRARGLALWVCLLLWAAGAASAQVTNFGRTTTGARGQDPLSAQGQGGWGSQIQSQTPGGGAQGPVNPFAPTVPGQSLQPGFQGFGGALPQFPGYPSYPQGFGPTASDPRDLLPGLFPVLGGPTRDPLAWPSWIDGGLEPSERRARPDRVVLVRSSDRVWYRPADEGAFVPLAHFDKFRSMESGSSVEVRNRGEFQLVFDDGAIARSVGSTLLLVSSLTDDGVELVLDDFRSFWVTCGARPLRVAFSDGSTITGQRCDLYFERRGGRGRLINYGPGPAEMSGRVGDVTLEQAHVVEVLLEPGRQRFVSPDLRLEGATRIDGREGRQVTVRADREGAVSWSGARFQLPAGGVLRLDALGGNDFPERAP
ncbi:MAG: hypothetical protein AAF628_16390 [Planctomycetota bacterium]